VDVPAGQPALVTATSGDGTFNPSISLVAGPAATCGGSPRVCLASDDTGATAAVNRALWTNATGSTVTIYAVVDTSSSSASGPFTMTLAFETPPAGDSCGTAERITVGMRSESTMGFVNDFGSGTNCAGTAGADRVYVISVGPGQTIDANVTSGDGTFDPSISLEAPCGPTPRVCIDGDDSGSATMLNTVTWTNAGASAQDVFIVIDGFSTTATGPFVMNVTLTP